MTGESETKSLRISVAVTPTELQRIEDAARVLGEREHIEITVSDILRSGAIRRAEEILQAAA